MAGRFTVEAIFKAVDRMTAPVGRMSGSVVRMAREAGRAIDRLDRGFTKVHRGIKSTGFVMAGATAAAGAGIVKLGRAGYDFEQAMSAVGAVGLQSRKEIEELEKTAIRLGGSTVFTATEVANAMETMKRAGFSNADVLAGIPGVLDAAAASGLEIADVSDIVSASLKGMGLQTSAAGRVADVLALASARTKSTMGTLGESMKNVASTARTLGIPFEQVAASVALLQDVGIDASTAGTSLKTALTRLTKPTRMVEQALSRVGLSVRSFKDAKGNMLPLDAVLQKLSRGAAKAGGNFDRVAFFARIFGLESQEAAGSLVRMFEEGKLAGLTRELEGAAGSAAKMAALRLDNLGGDVEQLGGAFDSLKIKMFDTQRGPLRGLVQGWTKWIEANDERIVHVTTRFMDKLIRDLPTIVSHVETGAKVLATFYGAYGVARVGKAVAVTFGSANTAVRATGTAAAWAATKVGLLDAATLKAGTGLSGLRGALNATALAGRINGVTSLMGKAGLLGAAAAVGVAIGSWLNKTFGLDEKLASLITQITGVNDALDNAGGRASKRGIQPGTDRHYATGEVIDQFGRRVRGADPGARMLVSPELPASMVPAPFAFAPSAQPEVSPMVTPPQKSLARELAHEIALEMESRQVVDVNVNTTTGAVDVKQKGSKARKSGSLRQPLSGER